jgi:hypothetical protein
MAARSFPVIAISIAALGASFGAAFLASAAPSEERACTADQLRLERVFAVETAGRDGTLRASYFAELGNGGSRAQVFTLRFDGEGVQDAQNGGRATSLQGYQNMPMLLGTQVLDADAKPMTSEAIGRAVRLNCRNW